MIFSSSVVVAVLLLLALNAVAAIHMKKVVVMKNGERTACRAKLLRLVQELEENDHDESKSHFHGKPTNLLVDLNMVVVEDLSDAALEFLQHNEDVEMVADDRLYYAIPDVETSEVVLLERPVRRLRGLATDAYFYYWGLDRISQEGEISPKYPPFTEADTVDSSFLYDPDPITRFGAGVEVYILDTGIDTQHNEFTRGESDRVQNQYPSNVVNNDGDGHGTHCAGTVGGYETGVAPSAKIVGVKVLDNSGSGSTSDIVSGVNYVMNQHELRSNVTMIISMSLGGECSPNCDSDVLIAAVERANEAGILVVVSAGNDEDDACRYAPAAAPSAVTVGATDIYDDVASYSNFGACVDVFAPGSSIVSACSIGTGSCTSESYYSKKSGTSMATPHVAGLAALYYKQTGISNNPEAVKAALVYHSVNGALDDTPTGTGNLLVQLPPPSLK